MKVTHRFRRGAAGEENSLPHGLAEGLCLSQTQPGPWIVTVPCCHPVPARELSERSELLSELRFHNACTGELSWPPLPVPFCHSPSSGTIVPAGKTFSHSLTRL